MVGTEFVGNDSRKDPFIEPSLPGREPDSERFDFAFRGLSHQSDNRARANPAAQERAKRHLAHEVKAYCFSERFEKTFDEKLFRLAIVGLRLDLPVASLLKLSVVPDCNVSGRELVNTFVDRVGSRY